MLNVYYNSNYHLRYFFPYIKYSKKSRRNALRNKMHSNLNKVSLKHPTVVPSPKHFIDKSYLHGIKLLSAFTHTIHAQMESIVDVLKK